MLHNSDPKGPNLAKKQISFEIFNLDCKLQSRLKFSISTFGIPPPPPKKKWVLLGGALEKIPISLENFNPGGKS